MGVGLAGRGLEQGLKEVDGIPEIAALIAGAGQLDQGRDRDAAVVGEASKPHIVYAEKTIEAGAAPLVHFVANHKSFFLISRFGLEHRVWGDYRLQSSAACGY